MHKIDDGDVTTYRNSTNNKNSDGGERKKSHSSTYQDPPPSPASLVMIIADHNCQSPDPRRNEFIVNLMEKELIHVLISRKLFSLLLVLKVISKPFALFGSSCFTIT